MSANITQPNDEVDSLLEHQTVVQELNALVQRKELLRRLSQDGRERIDLRTDREPDPAIVAEMRRQLVEGVDYAPADRAEHQPAWPIRAGVRLETLAFSPWLAHVPSIFRLPRSEEQFVAHYAGWLGKTHTNSDGMTLFEANFGFALEELYRAIEYLEPEREKPNPAYLTLMSGHFRLAMQMQPKLNLRLKGSRVVDAFMLLAELQRAANLVSEMDRCSTLLNADIRKAIRVPDHDHILVEAKKNKALGRIVDYAPLWNNTIALACGTFEKRGKYIKIDGLALRPSYLPEPERKRLDNAEQGIAPKAGSGPSNNNTENRASSIKPEYAFSYYSIDRRNLLYVAIEQIVRSWKMARKKEKSTKQTQKSGSHTDRARFAYFMQRALDSQPADTLKDRSTRHLGQGEDDFETYAISSENSFRHRQKTAAAASRIQLPPPGASGGSTNFCHHYWWHRYADDDLGRSLLHRRFDHIPLTGEEREDLAATMSRIEVFVKGPHETEKRDKTLIVEVFLDYATSLGANATDPAWSERLIEATQAIDAPSDEETQAIEAPSDGKTKANKDSSDKVKKKAYQKYDIVSRGFEEHRAKRSGGRQTRGQWVRHRNRKPMAVDVKPQTD